MTLVHLNVWFYSSQLRIYNYIITLVDPIQLNSVHAGFFFFWQKYMIRANETLEYTINRFLELKLILMSEFQLGGGGPTHTPPPMSRYM